jgi:hypothetical protein
MPHFPKLRRGSRRRLATTAEERHLAYESLQESLERLEELDERVDALRMRYQPWKKAHTGEFPAVQAAFQAGVPAVPSDNKE